MILFRVEAHYQKSDCGLLIYNVPDEKMKVVQVKAGKDSQWQDESNFKVVKDENILLIDGLECTTMDIRFVTSNDEETLFTSYVLKDVHIVGTPKFYIFPCASILRVRSFYDNFFGNQQRTHSSKFDNVSFSHENYSNDQCNHLYFLTRLSY